VSRSANKSFHTDPKSYAPFVALRYNATKGAKLFGLVNSALYSRRVKMSEDNISKVAKIIEEWNPLGDDANKIEDLDGYRIEAMDIISISKILSKKQNIKTSIEKVLTQAFGIKLDKAMLIKVSHEIEIILSEK